MKPLVTIVRILTGLLFIFSGLVKAIDPRGLAYKMQEFFEAWSNAGIMPRIMHRLDACALGFSIVMITLEVAVGIALLLGWNRKLTGWILVLLMLFFTFLTSYVLFSGKIRACGCFGDCIPLTPIQTFTKDIILLLCAVFILLNTKYIMPLFRRNVNAVVFFPGLAATLILQWYVLDHLPLKDCLPYKKGNDILALRKMPADAIPDKYDFTFVYEKDGVKKDFPATALPDSTWKFSERKEMLVSKGFNNVAPINDFSLTDSAGNDVTEQVLTTATPYYLLFLKDIDAHADKWITSLQQLMSTHKGALFFVVTAQKVSTQTFLRKHHIMVSDVLTADGTAIKTAARANPTIFAMKGSVVQGKWSWADFDNVP